MDRRKLIYIGSLLILTVIVSVTYFSYAFFTNKSEQRGKINVVAGTLNYNVKGKGLSNNSITIPGNTTKKIELTLESINTIDSKYELYYETTSNNIEVGYSSDTTDSTIGTIEAKGKKKITVFITNPTSSNITVTFNAEGGFTHNTLNRTLGKEIPSQTSICENWTTHVFNFDYNGTDGTDGSSQEFIAPCDGEYALETWGAQGGGNAGGYGANSIGYNVINANDIRYIVVGGQGKNGNSNNSIAAIRGLGGYNGGGNSGLPAQRTEGTYYSGGAGGGGATHIASVKGELKDLENYKDTGGTNKSNEIFIVSGAGGGYGLGNSLPGHGGGFHGNKSGTRIDSNSGNSIGGNTGGGTQTTGYVFGQGQTASNQVLSNYGAEGKGGSGAGWYGGTASQVTGNYSDDSGAGGSGYIGSPNLTNKAMYCYDCEESMDVDTYTISTTNSAYFAPSSSCPNGYSTDPISKCAKAGNGYARITYYGTNTTKVTYDYNYLPNDIFESEYNTTTFNPCCKSEYQITATGTTIDEYGKTYYQTGTNNWYFSKIGDYLPIDHTYTFRFEAKASENMSPRVGSEQGNQYTFNATTNWQTHTYTFKVLRDTSYRAFVFYSWASDTTKTLYIRNIQFQEGELYTKTVNYESGSTLSNIETPKRSGWTFDGWWTDPIGGTRVTSSTSVPNDDTTYYAHWKYITN